MPTPPVVVANCSGFFGDRFDAAREMVEGGPIDYLTGDYLAELTMLILWRTRNKSGVGYARTFLRQMEELIGTCHDRGIRVVTNAGGLEPARLAAELAALADRLGVGATIAHVEGDDLLPQLADLAAAGHPLAHLDTGKPLHELAAEPVTANAYLGAWGIVEALAGGADIVVCPRVTDASLVVGPAAFHHGWQRDDWDRLAGAVVAGHVIECGAQATGGNYAFFEEVPGLVRPGFPIAEVADDGSSVITKHPGTGGQVSVGTVTAQLLYEIAGHDYPNTDVVARFETIRLDDDGADRVRVSGVGGDPAPADTKVAINYVGGYRNSVVLELTGLAIEEKARLAESGLRAHLDEDGLDELAIHLVRRDHPNAETNELATADLVITAKSTDPAVVGRRFANAVVELMLSSYPGFYSPAPPSDATLYGVYWPTTVPSGLVTHRVVHADGRVVNITPSAPGLTRRAATSPPAIPVPPGGPTRRAPLGTLIGARSGDKGGNANVGLWARNDPAYAWLSAMLTEAEFRRLVPESADLEVRRYEFANLRALNFVVVGLLGEGVASSTRSDPQAKSLGEYVRSRLVEIPVSLLD